MGRPDSFKPKHNNPVKQARQEQKIWFGYEDVEDKLTKFKINGGLKGYKIEDITLPEHDIHKLASDFGEFMVDDKLEKTNRKNEEKIGREYKNYSVKTTQIRKIFQEIKKLYIRYEEDTTLSWDEISTELLLLIPKITFAKARDLLGKGQKNLGTIFILAIEACMIGKNDDAKKENFVRLYQLTESLVAYHRQYAGKEGK